jgi:hypothetical protein
MGVLLNNILSKTFDRFNWSIYWRDDKYIFHGPGVEHDYLAHHGQMLTIGGSRGGAREAPKSVMPDKVFCQWHWDQCMQAHIRGYALWPDLESQKMEVINSSRREYLSMEE